MDGSDSCNLVLTGLSATSRFSIANSDCSWFPPAGGPAATACCGAKLLKVLKLLSLLLPLKSSEGLSRKLGLKVCGGGKAFCSLAGSSKEREGAGVDGPWFEKLVNDCCCCGGDGGISVGLNCC